MTLVTLNCIDRLLFLPRACCVVIGQYPITSQFDQEPSMWASSFLQFLNHGIACTANVVKTLAAFGLALVTMKLRISALGEVRHAGLVLVQDRPGFHKILL